MQQAVRAARIVVLDDSTSVVRLLCRLLESEGYSNVVGLTDPHRFAAGFRDYSPDLLVLDLHMPHLDGFEVIAAVRPQVPRGTYFPILVLTGDCTSEMRQRALLAGAKDFLTKPFETAEATLRIRNLLETRMLHLALEDEKRLLELAVRERTRELEEVRLEILQRLALAAEYRDDSTLRHTERVGRTAALLAHDLGLDPEYIELVSRAAQLHDVGKIGIPDSILLKPGRLLPSEFEQMKDHTLIGARILAENRFELLQIAEEIAMTHHERWDGGGYPRGLTHDEIPLSGRIVALADVFDALTHERPYKEAWATGRAVAAILAERGGQFDPDVVDAFLRVKETLLELNERDGLLI